MDQIDFDYVDESKSKRMFIRWAKMQVQIITAKDLSRALARDATMSLAMFILGNEINPKNAYQIQYRLGDKNN